MKIKRFLAPDMRQAMGLVRDEQGPEAVILSTRRMADGIEVVAAIDYDATLMGGAARGTDAPVPPAAQMAGATVAPVPPSPQPQVQAPRGHAVPAPRHTAPRSAAATRSAPREPAPAPAAGFAGASEATRMREELGSLREMLETQLASLAWNDLERRQPLKALVLREMTKIGIGADVARALAAKLPDALSTEQARYLPLGLLSRNLMVSGRALPDGPAVTALVGPTGVGKTTTVAKLAARAVQRLGAAQVALVSTDHYRIGAAAQLEHYGRLLGVRVYPAYDGSSLRKVLELLAGCHTVLVDTAGIAVSDPRLVQQMEIFAGAGGLRVCLALAANAQADALDAAVEAYRPLRPAGCVLTKLDEAPSLGGALSALIRHRLPLDYVTDGQRVPEDIAPADVHQLVCRAVQGTRGTPPDETLLAARYGLAVAGA